MNKFAMLTLVSAVLVGGAFAQTAATKAPAAKAPATPKTIACAVMASNKVDVAKATKSGMFADYKGKRYFFCCGGCPAEFKANPAKYAKAASIPTPKPAKTATKA